LFFIYHVFIRMMILRTIRILELAVLVSCASAKKSSWAQEQNSFKLAAEADIADPPVRRQNSATARANGGKIQQEHLERRQATPQLDGAPVRRQNRQNQKVTAPQLPAAPGVRRHPPIPQSDTAGVRPGVRRHHPPSTAASTSTEPLGFFQVGELHNWTRTYHQQVKWAAFSLLSLWVAVFGFSFWPGLLGRRRQVHTGVRKRAQKLRVTSGQEILKNESLKVRPEDASVPAQSSGTIVRVQGRVVANNAAHALVAPFSDRASVMYSASVSDHHLDGVHRPPLSFHAAKTDFSIELADAPEVTISVHGDDVSLFDMADGAYVRDLSLQDAPEAWKGFALSYMHGSGGDQALKNGADQRLAGELEFRESVLLVGAMVTCVGELARDSSGVLHLYAWRPEPARPKLENGGGGSRVLCKTSKLMSWMSDRGTADQREGSFAGRVLVSDDPALLATMRWQIVL